jgi:DNA-binding NarL/FixJ family response regulator
MLTLLSDKEIHQIHTYVTEMAVAVENLTRILGGAQTVAFDVEQATSIKPAKAAAAAAPVKESQPKTRVYKARKQGKTSLSVRQVAEIKRLLSNGTSATAISRQYKVHYTTVYAIKSGRSWKNVQPADAKPLEIVEIRK